MDVLIYDRDKVHNQRVEELCFRYAFRENVDCDISVIDKTELMDTHLGAVELSELIMAGVRLLEESLHGDGRLEKHFIVLMGESARELMGAVSPALRPAGLLLKPVEKEPLEQILRELTLLEHEDKGGKDMFSFQIQSREYAIAKKEILYFESRNKRIILRTEHQEFSFYDTLDQLAARMGQDFVRVHKSFIVNLSRVCMIHFSNRTVHFPDESYVPLSRSYKAALAEAWERRRGEG